MKTYMIRIEITNTKYTLPVSEFEVQASNWHTAASRAVEAAVRRYKDQRGRRDRPIEISLDIRARKEIKCLL